MATYATLMQIHGELKMIFDEAKVSDNFKKREFVLLTDVQTPYPQEIIFQVTQANCDKLNGLTEGDEVSVDFNLRGRSWNGPQGIKWFNTLEAWKITPVNGSNSQPVKQQSQPAVKSTPAQTQINTNPASNNDDLPY